ncbi:uncharacterized protein LOC129634267 isoform X7 [Bubalus kerabau]|uniref:uncharacterized protein LOC129634267 isoform X7 n=1 Tax=Bubalus carabanensis TaxID=3119969 RepID=UPI00244E6D81|nr:uncharacterized protein LOC129634267 isoform X7 [Bubalus carabanensis]
MDLRDIFEQHCDWIQPGTTVLRKGDPQENISARKDLLTKFNGCSSDICINEGEKKKDPSLMEKEYPWVVKGLKAHTRQVGRLWLEPREPECTGTLTTADCLWLGFPGGSAGKEFARNAGDLVRSLGWEDPLEKGMATHSNILA